MEEKKIELFGDALQALIDAVDLDVSDTCFALICALSHHWTICSVDEASDDKFYDKARDLSMSLLEQAHRKFSENVHHPVRLDFRRSAGSA
jgi:hypothetical protein